MQSIHSWFLRLCALEGAFALYFLIRIPSEGDSLSPARLALIGIALSLAISLAMFSFRDPRKLDTTARPGMIWMMAVLSLVLSLILFLLRYLNPERLLPIYERMSPLLWYLLALSIQFSFYLLFLKNGFHLNSFKGNKYIFTASLRAFCVLLLVLLFVSVTRLGITKDEAYWGEPGVVILGWQFALAIFLGAAILVYQSVVLNSPNSRLLNVVLSLSIYLTAVLLWLNVPIATLRNSFYAPITPPYTMPFPYSDAGNYDYLSESLLIGTKYLGSIPPRSLYVTFLAALHFLFGQDYIKIIAAQTLVLALFPVALYVLGSRLHSRAAGLTIALIAIFRELTTLWISSNTRTASTKMFVTDFVTATAIAFTCLAALHWLERRDTRSALIAGGSFGLLLLLRTQSLIILPVLFALAFFVYQKRFKEWFRAGIVFGLAMALTIAPWLAHNYSVTGKLAFDDPAQMAVIYSQYSFNENLDISKFDFESESLGGRLISFTLQNPGYVGRFVANHFLNTEIGGLLALPLIKPFNGLLAPVNLYWITWDGTLEWYNLLLIIFYLVVLAIGIGAAWARYQWIGLVPLAFNLGYALANGISRFSSWRYNLPVDWVVYFYVGIGAIEIVLWVSQLFGARNVGVTKLASENPNDKPFDSKTRLSLLLAAFMLTGSLPWLAQGMAQPRYTSTPEQLKQEVASQGMNEQSLEQFLAQPDSVILEGRSLYPRFFRRDDGIFSTTPWPVYRVRDFARMGLVVINETFNAVILPSKTPLLIPYGSDIILLGCQREDYIEARWMLFPDSGKTFQVESLTTTCPP